MLVKPGEKLFIITRRLFENQLRRHFIGEVKEATESVVRIDGYPFVFNEGTAEFTRKDRRVLIFGLADSGHIIYTIPQDVNLDELSYQISQNDQLVITDGKAFELEISEFSHRR